VEHDWRFDGDELRIMESLGESLRADGWASHVTVPRLLDRWKHLTETVNAYNGVIDEYLDDLTCRDALQLVLGRAPESVRARLEHLVNESDQLYRTDTIPDGDQKLRRFFKITNDDGWWWHRIPKAGPISAEVE
jgi:hypothetical protein